MGDTDESDKLRRVARDRGILTERDRKYLHDESGVPAGSAHERMIRKDIRDRLTNALRDAQILAEYLPAKDRRMVAEEFHSDSDLQNNTATMIGFLYQLCAERPGIEFDDVLHSGIQRGAMAAGESIQKLRIHIETYPAALDDLRSGLEDGEGITLPEFQRLLEADALPEFGEDDSRVSFHLEIAETVEEFEDIRVRLERE